MGILTWSVVELIYQKCLRHFLQFAWLAPPMPMLMPMPTMVMWDMDMVLVWDMPDTDMDITEFPSDPALVLTPSLRDLMPLMFPSDPAPVLTPSPRDLMPPPKDL